MIRRMKMGQGTGPLRGVKVVEIAGIGPGGQLLTGGSHVLRVRRTVRGVGHAQMLGRVGPIGPAFGRTPRPASLAVDVVVTLPVNRRMIGRGRGHAVVHSMH
jgi:alpha-methylacyl-CoA racemase